MKRIRKFAVLSGLLLLGATLFARAGDAAEFSKECLGWKQEAGFDHQRSEACRGCQCIGQRLSKLSGSDKDAARKYLKIVLQYKGRSRDGLQRHFVEQIAQSDALSQVSREQSTRIFKFLGDVMGICKLAIGSKP